VLAPSPTGRSWRCTVWISRLSAHSTFAARARWSTGPQAPYAACPTPCHRHLPPPSDLHPRAGLPTLPARPRPTVVPVFFKLLAPRQDLRRSSLGGCVSHSGGNSSLRLPITRSRLAWSDTPPHIALRHSRARLRHSRRSWPPIHCRIARRSSAPR
jgi:hypothetical protein